MFSNRTRRSTAGVSHAGRPRVPRLRVSAAAAREPGKNGRPPLYCPDCRASRKISHQRKPRIDPSTLPDVAPPEAAPAQQAPVVRRQAADGGLETWWDGAIGRQGKSISSYRSRREGL